jgi:FkbM family methyltransferase
MAARATLLNLLNRRLPPAIAAPLGSVVLSLHQREPCRVAFRDGAWLHRYATGTVVQHRLAGPSARAQDREARDYFLYGYQPRENDVVFDVGAGMGGEVRLFSSLVGPAGRVISVEANPHTYQMLKRTVEVNQLDNVTAFWAAAADRNQVLHIQDDRDSHLANSLTTDNAGVDTPGHTLQYLVDLANVTHIDLLKMNIEGAELPALSCSENALHLVRNIVVSCHDFKADRTGDDTFRTRREVSELLMDNGFRLRSRPDDPRPWVRDFLYGVR